MEPLAAATPNDARFLRYLEAKRTIDDRALNRVVLEALGQKLRSPGFPARPRVLEIGAGTGSMLRRLWDWGVLCQAEYTLLDQDPALLEQGRQNLCALAARRGVEVTERADGALRFSGSEGHFEIYTRALDLETFLGSGEFGSYDLLIACAFLDLVDVPSVLPRLWSKLNEAGLFWFCINFDGETIFSPEHELDSRVLGLYHASMDSRVWQGRPSGDSKTGRHLFQSLANSGARLLASGSSDWVVHPVDGAYAADEAYFLRHIVETIHVELTGHPELDPAGLCAWVAKRNQQIDAAKLVYVAHQLDFFGLSRAVLE